VDLDAEPSDDPGDPAVDFEAEPRALESDLSRLRSLVEAEIFVEMMPFFRKFFTKSDSSWETSNDIKESAGTLLATLELRDIVLPSPPPEAFELALLSVGLGGLLLLFAPLP
jgi:hypothetical protein